MKIYLVKWAGKGYGADDGWFLTPNEDFVSLNSSTEMWERIEVHLTKDDAKECFKDDPESGTYFVVELEV